MWPVIWNNALQGFLSDEWSEYRIGMQMDAHEAMLFLLNKINDELSFGRYDQTEMLVPFNVIPH